jgi:phosphate uptake regulator
MVRIMETRKVQLTGGSTFTVSLPKSWVLDNAINAGDSLWIHPKPDGTLSLHPKESNEKISKKKTVEIGEDSYDHLIRKLIGLYMAGYNTIELNAKKRMDTESSRAIRNFTKMVIGPEIIDERPNSVILQDLIDPGEFSQEKGLRRMTLIVNSMHQDAVQSFMKGDGTLAKDVISRDADVDRLDWMIAKQYKMILKNIGLTKKIGVDSEKSLNILLISRIVERIGDHASRIAESVEMLGDTELDKKLIKDISKESKVALTMFEMAMSAFFRESLDEANAVIDMRKELGQMRSRLMHRIREQEGDVVVALTTINESIGRTGLYSTDISEIAINYIMTL